ncbi:MAG: extracellular solute-binding protein [Acetobacteraceae bacterium]|nr:extracellular solute-binding protein [Acetobacteraceae bacterium]
MLKSRISRRSVIRTAAVATALPLVHIRTAGAAGKLNVGFWDHWVPTANQTMRDQVNAWAEKNKVEVNIDFITSVGGKLLLTQQAEYQARRGHDILPISNWEVQNLSDRMEPMDDIVDHLQKQYGEYAPAYGYLGKIKGRWMAVPSSTGSLNLTMCGRISMLKQMAGFDPREMYPAAPSDKEIGQSWDYDMLLKVAEAIHKGGVPFAQGIGSTTDSINNVGAWYMAFGAELIDAQGKIAVKSDKMRQFLEYAQRLVKFLPADAKSYDDASNNRALISGKSALIMNPPSAWAVAKRDAPAVSEDTWTFPMPRGPAGRFIPYSFTFYTAWEFGQNKKAAKDLIRHLQERKQVEERCTSSEGFDLPAHTSMSNFAIWSDVGPPKGTVYNYPIRPWHGSQPSLTSMPAPPELGVQVYARGIHPGILARLQTGQSIKQVTDWAQEELEGFK